MAAGTLLAGGHSLSWGIVLPDAIGGPFIIAMMNVIDLKPRLSSNGQVKETERGWLLSIPAGGPTRYRLAQLDDHLRIQRRDYPRRSPFRFQLESRVSATGLPGTWGFGLWNDPYGFSFGPGNGFLRLPALPNAAWFFYSSPACYLSFRDDKPGNGFLAQLFSSPRFDPLLIPAAATFPFALKSTRRLLGRIISEDANRLDAPSAPGDTSSLDVTAWHQYALEWGLSQTRFFVDDVCVLDAALSPRSPLGMVIWIDNQHAGLTPQGKLSFGMEPNPEPAWLEIRDLVMT